MGVRSSDVITHIQSVGNLIARNRPQSYSVLSDKSLELCYTGRMIWGRKIVQEFSLVLFCWVMSKSVRVARRGPWRQAQGVQAPSRHKRPASRRQSPTGPCHLFRLALEPLELGAGK